MQEYVFPPRDLTENTVSDIARFKDEGVRVPRVVTLSRDFVIYALKNRAALRVLVKSTTPTTQLSFKQHTDAVTSASFVNHESNIVASTSENELCVWRIDTEEKQCTPIFTMPLKVVSLSWVIMQNRAPDLLLVHGDDSSGKFTASVLRGALDAAAESGEESFTPSPKLLADLGAGAAVTATTPLTTVSAPLLGFSVTDSTVATCTLGNTATPAWQPCDGEQVVGIALQGDALVAGSSSYVTLWTVAGEPRPMWRLRNNGMRCINLQATSTYMLAFLKSPEDSNESCTAAVIKTNPLEAAYFATPGVPTHATCCVASHRDDSPTILMDSGNSLQQCFFQNGKFIPAAPVEGQPLANTAAQLASIGVVPTVVPAGSAPPMTYAAATAQTPAQPGRSNVLRNTALPVGTDGGVAAAASESSADIDGLEQKMKQTVRNTASMLGLVKGLVTKDHEDRVQEALKAQLQAVLQVVATSSRDAAVSGDAASADQIMHVLIPATAEALHTSITASVEEQIKAQLDNYLRSAMAKHLRKQDKAQSSETKTKLDAIMAEVMTQAQKAVEDRHVAYGNTLMHYINENAIEGQKAVQSLTQTVDKLKKKLDDITNSGILEEVVALRAQVAELKSGDAAAPVEELAPETLLSKAQECMADGQHARALQWVFSGSNDDLVFPLLEPATDAIDAMLDDAEVADSMWERVVAALVAAPKADRLLVSLQWLTAILADKDGLLKNAQLRGAVSQYVSAWKSSSTLSSDAKDLLRHLMIAIR